MPSPAPEDAYLPELYIALVEAIAALSDPSEAEVRRVLRRFLTGDPQVDRVMREDAEALRRLAVSMPHVLRDIQEDGGPAAPRKYTATYGLDRPDRRRTHHAEDTGST